VNRLVDETSPYLRQHADNPVDWFPWGDDAFARARAEDKPVLLSVGYSSCHWCHVMAHESFEDPATAALMNDHFVNVKVDREERPDVDAVYMQAVQAMTGGGGWPMTVFLDHDGRPFFGGTYWPNEDRHGMPGFRRVLEAVSDGWRDRRAELLEQGEQLRQAIAESTRIGGDGSAPLPDRDARRAAAALVHRLFDARFGGFGQAPKFPQAMTLALLADAQAREPSSATLEMLTTSLDAMAAGGMYDQVGGGFHRYSVDAFWLVPHFEKMLYDQALLVRAYTQAWRLTRHPRYRRIVEETVGYVLRDLRHDDWGFFSAEDADSEGIEGKFYCWSLDEVEELLGHDAPEVIRYYGVTATGNFEDPHTGFRGNILHVVDREEEPSTAVLHARARLEQRRQGRVRPGLDDKVLLGWNALFLRSLADAAVAFERPGWMEAARSNARFLLTQLRRADGRFLRSWQGGRAAIPAYAEDYAAVLEALVTLAETDDVAWLADARLVADELLRLFSDDERGGFFTTGIDGDALVVRPKDTQDNATPAENSLAANGLLRLAALTGDESYAQRARRWVGALAPIAVQHPTAFAYLLGAVERAAEPSVEIVVVGDRADPRTQALVAEIEGRVIPASVHLVVGAGVDESASPLLEGRATAGVPTAYVCRHFACRRPVTTPDALRAEIDAVVRWT
jgi:uncharacterized protein YyaL (SSP411 family)